MPLLRRIKTQRPATLSTSGAGVDDGVLVSAARRNPHDFAPLFHRYWEPVLRYCAIRLPDEDDAEDAASQIFVDAYTSLHRFQDREGAGSFRSWLFTIAHHEIANRYRYRVRHPAGPLEAAEQTIRPDAPLEQAETADAIAQVVALVRELPDRPREVVELRLAGMTDREIAGVLGISGQAVRQAQSRAVAQLRVRMGVAPQAKRTPHA
jgi:RNA polymerase sigma-70 factor, ECF subfamily